MMQALTVTMPTSFESPPIFTRSRSSPNVPELVKFDYKTPNLPLETELPRSASYTSLPAVNPQYQPEKGISEEESTPADKADGILRDGDALVGQDGRRANKLTKEEPPKHERVGRRKSLIQRPKSWIQKAKGSPERPTSLDSGSIPMNDVPPVPAISKVPRDKTKTVSESFATFARKSWITSSRSPSPVRILGRDADLVKQGSKASDKAHDPPAYSGQLVEPAATMEQPASSKLPSSPGKPNLRRLSTLQKLKQKPVTVLTNLASASSSTSSLPLSSTDNKSTPRTSTDKVPPIPKTFSTEKLHYFEAPRRKDELWSAFRSLDNDFAKFQTKSWSLKTNVVRTTVLPFLKFHSSHPSNKNLRPEDLDRRITILNKWWTGILEVLDGRQNQTVSGVDRPILLEACYCIMIRPEWRTAPSHFAPFSERSASRSPTRSEISGLSKRKSSGSLNSSASQFIIESVHHNTKNLFIQNLLSQISFAVDKMSLRHAPASLVAFCGKAIAYAFFFVPGVADILVRVWKLPPENLRRVADDFDIPRRQTRFETDEVASAFPINLQSLTWTSPKAMSTQLRQVPPLSIMVGQINWHGPWVTRWCGRDSDLFFVFAKHYFILTEEFLPSEISLEMKARAPGFILVQAQILTVLDATIHRQKPVDPLPMTFEDVLAGADASAAALPLPSNNSARPMSENRLIMLLRDFLSEKTSEYETARMTFAVTFGKLMQATAGKTSLFDHNACFVLCDFLEEALTIYVRFRHTHNLESDFINWRFWLEVCKKVLESQNSMSEIRLFAFLFGAWTTLTNNQSRKEIICLDWLLTEENFGKFFCHWCPMVRAYFMRLLCWRLCRDNGEASDLDVKIFSTVSTRIKAIYSNYLHLKQAAERSHLLLPSTAPCHPAPGRRLLIIRNDNQAPSTNIFLGFDGITTSLDMTAGTTLPTINKRHSSLSSFTKAEPADPAVPKLTSDNPSLSPPRKRWSIIGKVLPTTFSTSNSPSASPSGSRSSSPTTTLEEARRETALARTNSHLTAKSIESVAPTTGAAKTSKTTTTYRPYCFRFSLEWAQHFEKPTNVAMQNGTSNGHIHGRGMRGGGGAGFNMGAERRIGPPRLPATAQGLVGLKVPGNGNELFSHDPAEGDVAGRAERVARAKYSGRALAEWALVVGECNNFVERRKAEGVPGLNLVEVPTLGVEGFRKVGG